MSKPDISIEPVFNKTEADILCVSYHFRPLIPLLLHIDHTKLLDSLSLQSTIYGFPVY